jgi:hypothetical protein
MADKKISALTAATLPLAGTEVLPIVQDGTTDNVAVNDLTVRNLRANATTGILQVTGPAAATTRVMTVPNANFTTARTDAAQSFTGDQTLTTGNLVVSNGKGIDFSATPGTGTSELFSDYEEGTWTPIDSSGAGLTFVAATGSYTKVGNLVSASGFVQFPVTASVLGITIGGLPFTSANTANRGVGALTYKQTAAAATLLLNNNATTMLVVTETGSVTTNVALSNAVLYFGVTYSI